MSWITIIWNWFLKHKKGLYSIIDIDRSTPVWLWVSMYFRVSRKECNLFEIANKTWCKLYKGGRWREKWELNTLRHLALSWLDMLFFFSVQLHCLVSHSERASDISVKAKSVCEPSGPSGRRFSAPVSIVWSDQEYFYSPLDGMLVHHRVTPSIKFAGATFIHLVGERHSES